MVKFLFQDDLLEPSCLERMLRASRSGVDLVVTRRGLIFEEGTPATIGDRYREYLAEHDLARHCRGQEYMAADQFSEILLGTPCRNCIGEPTATLIRRSAFERYGGFNRARGCGHAHRMSRGPTAVERLDVPDTCKTPLPTLTALLLWPFESLETRWRWPGHFGYMFALIAEKDAS